MWHYDCQLYKKWHEEIIFVTRVRNNNCNNNDTYTKVVITLKSSQEQAWSVSKRKERTR